MAKTGTASQEESPALREQTRMPNIPLKITAIYGLAGALWILFSDRILGFLVDDASVYAEFSTFKGWLFVAVTAAFLHRLVAREQGEFKRAVSLCKNAIKEEPKNAQHFLWLGRIHLLAGQKKDAIRIFRMGLRHQRSADIQKELDRLGARRDPPVPFLRRENPVNRVLGKALKIIGAR